MRCLAVSALLLLTAPALASGIPVVLSDCANLKSDCKNLIGMRLWVNVPRGNPNSVEISPSPDSWTNTTKLKTGDSFLVTGVVKDRTLGHNLIVKLSNGQTGYFSPGFNYMFIWATNPIEDRRKAIAECERRGQPRIGMTPAELIETCWRKPRRIVKKTTAAGVEESYIYGIGHVVKVIDGKVAEIIEAR